MEIIKTALAVNCHGWEDFPVYHRGHDAAELLACWTALWHPSLLQRINQLPCWRRLDEQPGDERGSVVLVPTFSADEFPESNRNAIVDSGGWVICGGRDREKLVEQILQAAAVPRGSFEAGVVADFYSLGYCYLQVQLMTRQLRYSCSLDQSQLINTLRNAVQTADRPESEEFTQSIAACFDLLAEARRSYYPTDALIADYVLLAPSTLGSQFRRTLRQPNPLNLQASGDTIRTLEQRAESKKLLVQRYTAGTLEVVGGEYCELPTILVSVVSWIEQLRFGLESCGAALGRSPTVFARRRFGLNGSLPGILHQFQLNQAVHQTFDDGVFPQTGSNNILWEGDGPATIDALVSPPLLASEAENFVDLGIKIGEAVDVNHFATVLLAHWPGDETDAYHDLINSSKFGSILGRFVTLGELFQEVNDPGYSQNYAADEYRDAWLTTLVDARAKDPISRHVDYWRQHVRLMQLEGMQAMAKACDVEIALPEQPSVIRRRIDQQLLDPQPLEGAWALPGLSETDWQSAVRAMCGIVSHRLESGGVLLVNSLGFRRRQLISQQLMGETADPLNLPVDDPTVVARDRASGQTSAVVAMPPMGYVWLPGGRGTSRVQGGSRQSTAPPLAEDHFLRNEFFEVEIDKATGGIRSIMFYNQRTNLMAQQLAVRQPSTEIPQWGTDSGRYSMMVADSVELTHCSETRGEIRTRGRLVQAGSPGSNGNPVLANYSQLVRIIRGKPIVELEMEIQPTEMPQGDPWENYVACRYAWNDETSELYTYANESRHPTRRTRITSPLAIDIDQHRFTTSILAGGVPFHRKVGYRQIDSLLVVPGETRRQFAMAIGVNLTHPLASALDVLATPTAAILERENDQSRHPRSDRHPPVDGAIEQAWIFHLNCKNVIPLSWQAVPGGQGQRVLLKETEGRSVDVQLKCWRPIKKAARVDFCGDVLTQIQPQQGEIQLPIAGHEVALVEIHW